jgi:hypothetical protein
VGHYTRPLVSVDMIQYHTIHNLGARAIDPRRARGRGRRPNVWVRKYFDPWLPHDHLLQERELLSSPERNDETVGPEHKELFDLITPEQHFTENVCMWAEKVMSGLLPWDVFGDICDDVYLPRDPKRIALFVFWKQRRISWNAKLFLECQWPSLIESQIEEAVRPME